MRAAIILTCFLTGGAAAADSQMDAYFRGYDAGYDAGYQRGLRGSIPTGFSGGGGTLNIPEASLNTWGGGVQGGGGQQMTVPLAEFLQQSDDRYFALKLQRGAQTLSLGHVLAPIDGGIDPSEVTGADLFQSLQIDRERFLGTGGEIVIFEAEQMAGHGDSPVTGWSTGADAEQGLQEIQIDPGAFQQIVTGLEVDTGAALALFPSEVISPQR
ncbi:MAG TPA: hypothetical protein DEB47_22405 [Citreicella sp.]|nr:hypothetical protein [Citreicella sp.]